MSETAFHQIEHCEGGSNTDGNYQVEHCENDSSQDGSYQIEHCPDDNAETETTTPEFPNPCTSADGMSISTASEDVGVGSSFNISGGIAPVTWSFDGGSIVDGVITSIDACGASGSPRWATVTASDSCGQSASIEVRLPGGVWAKTYSCDSRVTCGGTTYCGQFCYRKITAGGGEIHYGGAPMPGCALTLNDGCNGYVPCDCGGCKSIGSLGSLTGGIAECYDEELYTHMYVTQELQYEWQCP